MKTPFLVAATVLLVACGGSKPKAATPAPADTAVDAGTVADDSGAATTPSAPSASAATAAVTPPAAKSESPAPAPSADVPDECSKAAVPYEEKVRPFFNECYREGKKKNPELQGVIRITLAVNMSGKVNSAKPAPSELGDTVVSCMVKAVKDHPFDGALCKGKSVMVGKTFGKPGG